MENLINNDVFFLVLNLGVYILCSILMNFFKIKFMNSLLPSIFIVIAILYFYDIEYEVYKENSELISIFLGPCVVSLGYILHKNIDAIKSNIKSILVSISVGAVVNLLIINFMFSLFDVDTSIIYSIQPKSVTTPIAISLSESNGGIPALAVIAVTIAGIFGSVAGVSLLKLFRINEPISQGLALGASAHAIGTSRAIELGLKQGAMGGLAIGLTGLITSLLLSFFKDILL